MTFEEQNGKYFKAFSNIYVHVKINFYIFLCFKWEGCFYKHLEKCLQEMTIVPHGVIVSQSGAISCFFLFCFFGKVMLDLWNLRDLHAVDTELHSTVTGSESVIGSDMCFFFLFHFFLSRLPPAFSSRNTTSQEVKAQRQRVWHFLM